MPDEIFREKSLNRVKSPEDLNDYIRVANPGVWMVLAAVILLLMGVCIWGLFGRIETKISAHLVSENGVKVCSVESGYENKIAVGMKVKTDTAEGVIVSVDEGIVADISLPDGTYDAEIITESLKPLSFVFN